MTRSETSPFIGSNLVNLNLMVPKLALGLAIGLAPFVIILRSSNPVHFRPKPVPRVKFGILRRVMSAILGERLVVTLPLVPPNKAKKTGLPFSYILFETQSAN